MICSKCGQQLADDDIFCDKCGNKAAQQAQQFEPQPEQNAPQSIQPTQPQHTQQTQPKQYAQKTLPPVKKSGKKIVVICVAAAVAVVVTVLVLVLFVLPAISGNNNSSASSWTSEESDDDKISSEENRKEPTDSEVYSVISEESKESEASPIENDKKISDFFYKKGQTLYICENGENIRDIVSSVSLNDYKICKDGSVLLYLDSTRLYARDIGENSDSYEIASSVQNYVLSDNGSTVLYKTADNDIYRYYIDSQKNELVASDIKFIHKTSADLRNIAYFDSNYDLYIIQGESENKIKIESGFDILENYVMNDRYFYVFVDNDFSSACYILDGDLYYKQIGGERKLLAENIDHIYGGSINVDADDFYYWDKSKNLYYYKDGVTAKVTDEVDWFLYHFNNFNGNIGHFKFDDESSVYVCGEKAVTLDFDISNMIYADVSEDEKTLYYSYKEEGDKSCILYKADITGSITVSEEVDRDIIGLFGFTEDGKLLYGKKNETSSYDLYIDGEKVDSNLKNYGFVRYQDGKYYYITDCKAENESGTFKCYTPGGNIETIDENVNSFDILPSGEVLYIKDNYSSIVDGNMSYYNGDLYIYDGKNSVKIDENVSISPENDSICKNFAPSR